MFLLSGLLGFSLSTLASAALPQTPLLQNPDHGEASYNIPTVHESAVLARRMLRQSSIATLSTIFPSTSSSEQDAPLHAAENRPATVAGAPIGLMDYYADCFPGGNPAILAIDIATTFRNAGSGSNVSLSLTWTTSDRKWDSPASLPRFSVIGRLVDVPSGDWETDWKLRACFLLKHPDAVSWLPGGRIHRSHWTKLVVEEIYWIGGFGDRAYIGWIPKEEWTSITDAEIDKARLPGEEPASSGSFWRSWW